MKTLADFLTFEPHGRKIAFIEQSPYRIQKHSYQEIAAGIGRVRSSLTGLGIANGDRVILQGENSARWAITFYACVLSGIVVVPIDASFSASFVEKVQSITGAKMILCEGDPAAWNHLFESEAIQEAPFLADDDTLLEIIFTSGTTGEPKGVMITHGNVLSNLVPIQKEYEKYKSYALPFSPIRFVHLIPLSHLFGQIMGLFIPQMLTGTVIFSDVSPPQVIAAAKKNKASAVICVPQQLSMLRKYVRKRYEITSPNGGGKGVTGILKKWWRYRGLHREFGWKFWAFIVGGATLPVDEEIFWSGTGFAVIQGYGLTETAPSITITHPFKGIRRGSVGKKLPGLDVRIAEDGEILVRGPNVSPGYYQNQAATEEVFKDGWLHTGDLGRFDEQGNLQLLGRKKDVIVTAEGLNVFPEDVETVLNDDHRIKESAIVPKQEEGRSVVHAVLVLQENIRGDEAQRIVSEANAKLEAFQRIHSFSIWPERELPRTTTGKLKHFAIAQGIPQQPASKTSTEDVVAKLLARSDEDARLDEDLGLSSLDRVELLVGLESESGLKIDEAQFARARTFRDVAKLIDQPSTAPSSYYPFWKWPQWILIKAARSLLRYVLVFPALRIRVKVKASGLENLEEVSSPVLFVSNHQSILDVPVILRALPCRFRARLAPAMGTGRTAIERYLAAFFFNTYPLPGTSVGLRSALQHTGELADKGYCPLVFPEGARTENGKMLPFRAGIGVITKQTKLRVVPILIRGLFEIWPVFARGPRRSGTVSVHFGPLMDFAGKDPTVITAELERWYFDEER